MMVDNKVAYLKGRASAFDEIVQRFQYVIDKDTRKNPLAQLIFRGILPNTQALANNARREVIELLTQDNTKGEPSAEAD